MRSISSEKQIIEVQRARVLDAMAQVVATQGLRHATVSSVLERGVSRAMFYGMFRGLDDCFLALLNDAMSRAVALIVAAFDGERSWADGVVAGLAALLGFLDAEPVLARVCLIETLAAGSRAREQRTRHLRELEPLLGAAGLSHGGHPLRLDAEGTIAAVAGILQGRLVAGKAPPFMELLGLLTSFVLAQRLDPESVARATTRAMQLARELAQESVARPMAGEDHVFPKELARPTAFRARACLCRLAERPESSNHAIGMAIDLRHPGQMSALLGRLERAGLVAKRSGGRVARTCGGLRRGARRRPARSTRSTGPRRRFGRPFTFADGRCRICESLSQTPSVVYVTS